MLLMITSTSNELLRNVNIDDLKWPWALKILVFNDFWRFWAAKKWIATKWIEIWKSKAITLETKLSILKTCVFSTMLYGCETWTVTKRYESRILSFERKCYRKILRIGWTQKVTNEELYRKIQLAETLLQKVIQRKLRLFGHICRLSLIHISEPTRPY